MDSLSKRLIFFSTMLFGLSILLIGSGCNRQKQLAEKQLNERPPEEQIFEQVEDQIAESPKDSLFLYYQKTPCFGTCPIFKMTIYQSGYAIYEGDNFVDMMGTFQARFSDEHMASISAVARHIGYFDMGERYDDPMVTDLPSTIVEMIDERGERKKVLNRYQGPAELQDLYKLINEIIDQVEWKPIENNK